MSLSTFRRSTQDFCNDEGVKGIKSVSPDHNVSTRTSTPTSLSQHQYAKGWGASVQRNDFRLVRVTQTPVSADPVLVLQVCDVCKVFDDLRGRILVLIKKLKADIAHLNSMLASDEDPEHTNGRATTRRPTLDHNMVYVPGKNLKLRPFYARSKRRNFFYFFLLHKRVKSILPPCPVLHPCL